jgi:hypothetical protein
VIDLDPLEGYGAFLVQVGSPVSTSIMYIPFTDRGQNSTRRAQKRFGTEYSLFEYFPCVRSLQVCSECVVIYTWLTHFNVQQAPSFLAVSPSVSLSLFSPLFTETLPCCLPHCLILPSIFCLLSHFTVFGPAASVFCLRLRFCTLL